MSDDYLSNEGRRIRYYFTAMFFTLIMSRIVRTTSHEVLRCEMPRPGSSPAWS